ncbi:octopamine receptor beta-2R-like [Antedon mediterranea]|uniref:octopamine receptor beta-2R-like n=1 Tax=Antedon mediterranea TaxID=105859 RepID=UPI003AF93CEE
MSLDNFTEYTMMSSLDNNMLNGSDNVTNTEPQEEQVIPIVESIILIILCVVGLFGNVLTIAAIVRTNKLRITANYFLVNLALADIIVCVIVEPFYLLTLFSGRWPFSSNTFCVILAGISIITLSSSVLNLLAIAVNRYFCIVQNQRYATLYTTRRTVFYCVMIWVGSSIVIIPAGFGILGFNEHYLACGYIDSDDSWIFQIINMVILFTFSIITFVFCYYKIWKEAHMSSTRTKQCSSSSTTSQVCLPGSVGTLTKLQKHLSKSKLNTQTREIQVAKTSFIVLSAFIICWTPFVLLVVLHKKHVAPSVLASMLVLLSLANSSINPFIFAWRNRQFRNAYKRIITCRHFFEKSVKDISSRRRTDDSTTEL